MTDCAMFGVSTSKAQGNPLTDAQRNLLDLYGICHRCKQGRHPTDQCRAGANRRPPAGNAP
jgi:hypothetical protein